MQSDFMQIFRHVLTFEIKAHFLLNAGVEVKLAVYDSNPGAGRGLSHALKSEY